MTIQMLAFGHLLRSKQCGVPFERSAGDQSAA